ncbi:rod shape-determining protein [Solibacillus sp. FSL H8-0523]|uniref:rod shape-determining protein n=1 Tax=unclassified Solibacillus TaxID=2637870 RepID=UPI00310164D8
MGLFANKGPAIGIDLGTDNILIYLRNEGIVVNEPTIIAIDTKTQKVLAVGEKAKAMQGRTHAGIKIVRPIRDGVITDFTATSALLQHYVKELSAKRFGSRKPFIVVSMPTDITAVERRAVIEAAIQAGAKEAIVVEDTVAAAIGAGLPVWEPTGSMIVDIGGGTTEVAIISLGGVVVSNSIKVGGDEMDHLIIKHVKNKHHLLIGEATAEQIKNNIFSEEQNGKMIVGGRDVVKGLPQKIELTATEVEQVLKEAIDQINGVIKQTLELTPPEIAGDIIERGLLLSGGIALLPWLEKSISEETKLPVILAENPLENVVNGTAKIIENNNFKEFL